jgi:hypothetical protein
MAGGDNKFVQNFNSVYNEIDVQKKVEIGVVASINDPEGLGRIKVKIAGTAQRSGDGNNPNTPISELPWCYPMLPKFISVTPKVGEGVFVIITSSQKKYEDRLYIGPIISQLPNLTKDSIESALSVLSFGEILPSTSPNNIKSLNGVFPNEDDIAIQGRYNTDLIFRKNEILIRSGKFVEVEKTQENPYGIVFNKKQGFIQIKNNVTINQDGEPNKIGTVVNLVADKINLITHDGTPIFQELVNQDTQLNDQQILNIIKNAHPVPFGDVLLEYLILLKNALLNHVHNGNKATDLIVGGNKQDVLEFTKKASTLENKMLSNNIRIN